MPVEHITFLPALPPRPADGHKGTFGHVLIVAGSRGMSGAASLAGLGALRTGAGLVSVAVPAEIQPIVAAVEPSYLTRGLSADVEGRFDAGAQAALSVIIGGYDVVACGSGWGRSPALTALAAWIYRDLKQPVVVDADALNALAEGGTIRAGRPPAPRILTPHPGEFARLLGTDIAAVQSNREDLAARFAAQQEVVIVLKGSRSVITDGTRLALNATGNSGMATGGTGDVLTGVIAALLGQGLPAFEAAQLGAHLHGLAGDLAAAELSQPGLIASDLPRYLPAAWKALGAK